MVFKVFFLGPYGFPHAYKCHAKQILNFLILATDIRVPYFVFSQAHPSYAGRFFPDPTYGDFSNYQTYIAITVKPNDPINFKMVLDFECTKMTMS